MVGTSFWTLKDTATDSDSCSSPSTSHHKTNCRLPYPALSVENSKASMGCGRTPEPYCIPYFTDVWLHCAVPGDKCPMAPRQQHLGDANPGRSSNRHSRSTSTHRVCTHMHHKSLCSCSMRCVYHVYPMHMCFYTVYGMLLHRNGTLWTWEITGILRDYRICNSYFIVILKKLFKAFKNLFIVGDAFHGMQLEGVCSCLPPSETQELNSSHTAWWKGPLPSRSPLWKLLSSVLCNGFLSCRYYSC